MLEPDFLPYIYEKYPDLNSLFISAEDPKYGETLFSIDNEDYTDTSSIENYSVADLKRQEEIEFNPVPFQESEHKGNTEITHPFDPTKIDIRPQPLTILSLIKRLESSPMRINLDTEFQRKADLWNVEAQSRLIESLLVRIPLPAFYFDATAETWLIVDGLQRISALKNFILDRNFRLTGLEYLKNFNGMEWFDLPEYLRTRVEETAITAYLINPGTPKEVKFNIFKRINTGGLVLSAQEIRHALNQGSAAKLVAELAKMEIFIEAMGGRVPSDRMEDRDYTTRFLSFYLNLEKYQPDLDSFLNNGMATANNMSAEGLEQIKIDFKKSMKASIDIFGKYAFRKKYEPDERRKPINKALFECISVALAKLPADQIKILTSKKKIVDKGLMWLCGYDNEFYLAISSSTGDILSVNRRHSKINELFNNIIYDRVDSIA